MCVLNTYMSGPRTHAVAYNTLSAVGKSECRSASTRWQIYLVLVDHYSDYIELEPLRNTWGVTVIRAIKRNFARHGIPDECVTDNGPQFVSHEYASFAREYGFTSIKSSPYHSRGNGKAESAVKIAKNIIKKSRFEDPYLALLAYRVTPQQGYECPILTSTATHVS